MTETLYLLDGMALIYRAHFALIKSPIFTSRGINTSALYGFTNTMLDIIENAKPDRLAIALDTSEPTARHEKFPAYKAQREEIPEDIAAAIPTIERLAAAMNIAVLKAPGYEADDIIGTLAARHASSDLEVMMVTPDKDFAQLVNGHVRIYKPGRMGNEAEIIGVDEVLEKWCVSEPARVADVLGLWGDASDNIPGIPGFGEKTAKKLIGQYGSLEGIYAHLDDLSAKQREKLETFRDQAFLSRELATIDRDVPLDADPESLRIGPYDDAILQRLLIEFEFNSIGRRLYGPAFKAGRGDPGPAASATPAQGELFVLAAPEQDAGTAMVQPALKTIGDIAHDYRLVQSLEDATALASSLCNQSRFCFDLETDRLNPRHARIAGIAFSWQSGQAAYLDLASADAALRDRLIAAITPALTAPSILKIGHNLKFDLSILAWNGVAFAGPFFDTMIAHALLEPDRRHGMDALAEQYLGYTPIPITDLIGEKGASQKTMFDVDPERVAAYAGEDADVTLRLMDLFVPRLTELGLDRVFHDIEMPLLPVIVRMEKEGIRLDGEALHAASIELAGQIEALQHRIHELAGGPFNLNSPRQLGEILFDRLALVEKPKKTRTGQYATDESILAELAGQHEIARLVLDYREASKLKSTYVDALPQYVFEGTGRIHTSFSQTGAVTGRLASANPNLQNIPIRTTMGQQIRAAFTASSADRVLLSADYSQIELRVMAELSGDPAMMEAFAAGLDIHAATAARVYGVTLDAVTPDMRRSAKMVNFGIIYGISAFGLAQRLGIPRAEAGRIIDQYFEKYPGVKAYMDETVRSCRDRGFVETMTGRRRWIRDINSANATIRGAAERTAINTPIQGTAADMIKIAMIRIDERLASSGLASRMILQVHDELLFDLVPSEKEEVTDLVTDCMRQAIPMRVPIVVETGAGFTWLQAH